MVAVLWGGIIGAVYPVVEVVFKNKSMQQWVDEKIVENQTTIAAKSAELEQLQQKLAAAEKDGDRRRSSENRNRQSTTRRMNASRPTSSLWAAKTAEPWIDAYLPADPFERSCSSPSSCCWER